jgi:hypothetical protein
MPLRHTEEEAPGQGGEIYHAKGEAGEVEDMD